MSVSVFQNFLKTLIFQWFYKVVHKIFKKWTTIDVHFFLKTLESNISIILHFMAYYSCPLFFDLWRYYMPIF